jgi:hypothetical protein
VIERVPAFKYLGRILRCDDRDTDAITDALTQGRSALFALKRNIFTRHLDPTTKLRILRSVIEPRVLYCAETWALTTSLATRIDSFQQQALRHCLSMHPVLRSGKPRYPRREEVLSAAHDPPLLSSLVRDRARAFWTQTLLLPRTALLHQALLGAVLGTSKLNTGLGRLVRSLDSVDVDARDDGDSDPSSSPRTVAQSGPALPIEQRTPSGAHRHGA